MSNAKKIALLEYKNKILEDIKYCEKGINDLRTSLSNNKYYQDPDSSDSEDGLLDIIDTGPGVQKLQQQQSMLKTCLNATQELTGLNILQSEVNILVQDPQFNSETPVTEPGTWREVTAECRIDLVPFTITFFTHKGIRKFAPTLYMGLNISLVKPSHEVELNHSVLQTLKKPSNGVEVIRSYAKEYRSRRTTLAYLANKYANSLFMEPHPEGGFVLKCANLLEILWRLENKWSPLAPFHHRMKFDLEYMDESYVKIITQAHKELLDPSIQTDERTLLLSTIISTCLEAKGPVDSESDMESVGVKSKRTENQTEIEATDKDRAVMAPPKNLPMKTKKIVANNKDKNTALKRSMEDSSNDIDTKKTKLTENGGVKRNTKSKENNDDLRKNKTESNDDSEKNNDHIRKQSNENADINNIEINAKSNLKASKKNDRINVEKTVNNTSGRDKKIKNSENIGRKRKNESDIQRENNNNEGNGNNTEKQNISKEVKNGNAIKEKNAKNGETNKTTSKPTNSEKSDKENKNSNEQQKHTNNDTTEDVSKKNKNSSNEQFDKQTHKDVRKEKSSTNTIKGDKHIDKNNKQSKFVNNDNSHNIPKKIKKTDTSEFEKNPHEDVKKQNDKNFVKPSKVHSETKDARLKKNYDNFSDVTKKNKNTNDGVTQSNFRKGLGRENNSKDGVPVRKIDKKTKMSIAGDKKFDVILKKTATYENNGSGFNNINKVQVEKHSSSIYTHRKKMSGTITKNIKSNEAVKIKKSGNLHSIEKATEKNAKNKQKIDKINIIHNTGENILLNQKLNPNKPVVLPKNNYNKLSKITTKTVKNAHKSPSRKNPLKLQNMEKPGNTRPFARNKILTGLNKEKENEEKLSKIPQKKKEVNNDNNVKKNMLRISPRKLVSKFKSMIQENTKNMMKSTNIPRLMKKPVPRMSK